MVALSAFGPATDGAHPIWIPPGRTVTLHYRTNGTVERCWTVVSPDTQNAGPTTCCLDHLFQFLVPELWAPLGSVLSGPDPGPRALHAARSAITHTAPDAGATGPLLLQWSLHSVLPDHYLQHTGFPIPPYPPTYLFGWRDVTRYPGGT